MTGWVSSLQALVVAVTSLLTASTAFLGYFTVHQSTQLKHQGQTIAAQRSQISQLKQSLQATPSAPHSPPPSASSSDSINGGAGPAGGVYLSALSPTVNGANTGPQTIKNLSYTNSVSFDCPGSPSTPYVAYDVSGYHTFTALVGLADNTQNAIGDEGTVTFTDQNNRQLGKAVTVALGSPARVTLNIVGVTQLGATCVGRNVATQSWVDIPVVLGNAAVS